MKPRTDQTRVRQRAIERTVFPSVRVASESPEGADHQGEPGLPGKSRPLADHLLPHVEGRCFYESLSAAKPRLQSDSRIERCTCVSAREVRIVSSPLEEAMALHKKVVRQFSTKRADAALSSREMFVLNAKLATPLAISNRGNHKTRGLRAIRSCPPAAIQVPTKYGRGY